MRSLVDAIGLVVLTTEPQVVSGVGDPAPPTVAAYVTEDARSLGYDTFDADGNLVFRVTFTAVSGESHDRPASERVWEARRVRFLPELARAVDRTTSLECPGFLHILERLAEMEVGRFDIPGITEAPVTIGPTVKDGYAYRFHGWGRGVANDRTRLSIEGSGGLVGDLGREADFQLKYCWRADPRR